MKKNYYKPEVNKLKAASRANRNLNARKSMELPKRDKSRPMSVFSTSVMNQTPNNPASMIMTPKLLSSIDLISIEVSPKNKPLQNSKSQNMFETKTYVRKQQYKRMTALLEKEEAEIFEK